MAFNINTKSVPDTTVLHLLDPVTREPMFADDAQTQPVTIEVYGRASKQYAAWQTDANRKAVQRRAKYGKDKEQTLEEQRESTVDLLVAITKSVQNLEYNDELADNPITIRAMYSDKSLYWIGDDVAALIGDTATFLQK